MKLFSRIPKWSGGGRGCRRNRRMPFTSWIPISRMIARIYGTYYVLPIGRSKVCRASSVVRGRGRARRLCDSRNDWSSRESAAGSGAGGSRPINARERAEPFAGTRSQRDVRGRRRETALHFVPACALRASAQPGNYFVLRRDRRGKPRANGFVQRHPHCCVPNYLARLKIDKLTK